MKFKIGDTSKAWKEFFDKHPKFKEDKVNELKELLTLTLVERLKKQLDNPNNNE